MHFDVIIVGAGPAGLACANKLAGSGRSVLVLERKAILGPKSCAGGITWNGLVNSTPKELIERSFPEQHIRSRLQAITVTSNTPIIATVDRQKLGEYMADKARQKGAEIRCSTSVTGITDKSVEVYDQSARKKEKITFNYLVGADGSSSIVRRYLGIATDYIGMGINYQIDVEYEKMEWHLHDRFFQNGYGWIFPHRTSCSVGAYIPQLSLSPARLKEQLVDWAKPLGFNLEKEKCTAGLINHDYQGVEFGNVFLVGDAAGLTSALTGEGIYSAIISAQTVAARIIDPKSDMSGLGDMVKKHKRFSTMVRLTGKNAIISSFLAELGLLSLRSGMLDFSKMEMG